MARMIRHVAAASAAAAVVLAALTAGAQEQGGGEVPPDRPVDEQKPPEIKDPSDVRNAIGNLSLIRGFEKLSRPQPPGLWQQFVNQPYFTPAVRAKKLLFFGQYEDAEAKYGPLLKESPGSQEYIEGMCEAILRQGHDADRRRFSERVAGLTEAQRSTPRMLRLRAEALVAGGKSDEARSLLKPFVDAHTRPDANDGETLAACMMYAQLLERRGQYAAAAGLYDRLLGLLEGKLPEDTQAATQMALAVWRSSVLSATSRDRNRTAMWDLAAVTSQDGSYWPAILVESRILVAAHNDREAGQAIGDVLSRNPSDIETRFLSVDHALETYDFDAARQQLDEIKLRSDIAEVSAYEGRMLLKERLPEQAVAPLQKALARDPELMRARGWLAGAYYLLNDPGKMSEQIAAATGVDGQPHPVALFEAGEILRDARQTAQAEKLYQQAQQLAAWWSEPPAALGELYLDAGVEAKAKSSLERSYQIDPFNLRAVNQLTLLGILEKFATKESKARLAAGSDKPAFIIRYNRQDEIVAELAIDWLERIRPEIWSYFQVTEMPAPTTIEMFPLHEQFSVRTTGLPWIGTVGASTGSVIAMDVPRGGSADTLGNFDWARVLRHEYTHTVTLAMTNNRIPHWLTEACACSQEQAPRDWDNCQLLCSNYRAGTLFKLADLNWGFIRPKRTIDRQLAYMQSQWIYEYLIATYGLPKMLDFLRCFRDGLSEAQAWQKAYGKKMEEVDKDFLAWAGKQLDSWGLPSDPLPKRDELEAALKKNAEDKEALYKLAVLQASGGDNNGARTHLEKLIKLDAKNIAGRELLGAILNALKEKDAARTMLEGVVADDPKRPVAVRTLGLLAMGRQDYDAAVKWFTQLQALRPLESTSYTNLAGIYLLRKEDDKAAGQLLELERHEQKDARIPRKLADLYLQIKQLPEAEQAAYRAIRIDPYSAVNHELMAQVIVAEGDVKRSIDSWAHATELQPRVAEFWEGLAEAKGQAGDAAGAAEAAKKAVELQPNSKAGKWIK